MKLRITDDSGFMGLVNVDRYESFVSKDWDFEMLKKHFISQMKMKNLLIWSTGVGNYWKVEINNGFSDIKGFREIIGQIKVDKQLYLINYEDLTMVAQYKEKKLPPDHHKNLFFPLEKGNYKVKVIQLHNPETYDFEADLEFIIEIERDDNFELEWSEIPWNIF